MMCIKASLTSGQHHFQKSSSLQFEMASKQDNDYYYFRVVFCFKRFLDFEREYFAMNSLPHL